MLKDGIHLFSGPDFTKAIYEDLGFIVQDLRSGKITKQQAVARAERLNSNLAKEFREWASLGINVVAMMIGVASFVLTYLSYKNSNRTLEEVTVDAVESAYRSQQDDLRPTLSWENYFREPKAKHDDFRPANANGLNRKERRAAEAKARTDRRPTANGR